MSGEVELTPATRENFFPENLERIADGLLPDYENAPKNIPLASTNFLELVRRFREESTDKLVRRIKGVTEISNRVNKFHKTRLWRSEFWDTEYYQKIYSEEDFFLVSPVQKGGFNQVVDTEKVKAGRPRRALIHSHSSEGSFSPPDMAIFFEMADPEKSVVENLIALPRLPALQVVTTDSGFFLAYPTRKACVPNQEAMRQDFLVFNDIKGKEMEHDVLRNRYQQLWDELVEKYGIDKLSYFLGDRIMGRSLMPKGVNERGVAFINLHNLILLAEKYKIRLYYMGKEEDTFRIVEGVEDIYKELSSS